MYIPRIAEEGAINRKPGLEGAREEPVFFKSLQSPLARCSMGDNVLGAMVHLYLDYANQKQKIQRRNCSDIWPTVMTSDRPSSEENEHDRYLKARSSCDEQTAVE